MGLPPSELLREGNRRQHLAEIARFWDATSVRWCRTVEYHVVRRDHRRMVHMEMGPFSGFSSLTAHAGGDFWIAVLGRPDLLLGGDRYAQREANTVRFAGIVPHGWENPHADPTEVSVATLRYS
jgi:hypothetical protein